MELIQQPKLTFTGIRVCDINLTSPENASKDVVKSLKLSLNYEQGYPEDQLNNFNIIFNIKLTEEKSKFHFKMKAIGHFISNQEITEEFKESDFVKYNAAAIAFPYLRSFISTLFINAGFNPLILPTFNFFALKNQSQATAKK